MMAVALATTLGAPAALQGLEPTTGPGNLEGWTPTPQHVALFAPPALRDHYAAFVTPLALDAVLDRILAMGVAAPPGAWRPEALGPADAFGLSGPYNRWSLARVYRAASARVARGPHRTSGQLEAWTLISPYPDAALTTLERGTLLIVARVPPR